MLAKGKASDQRERAMSKFTLQQIFDKIVTKLRAQNKRSIAIYKDYEGIPNEGCAYRGENGCRCAIGWMIPNKYYRKWMEGFTPDTHQGGNYTKLYETLIKVGFTDDQIEFMKRLQSIHDIENQWNNREYYWTRVANYYGLTVPLAPQTTKGTNHDL